jgi:hypothetical protein
MPQFLHRLTGPGLQVRFVETASAVPWERGSGRETAEAPLRFVPYGAMSFAVSNRVRHVTDIVKDSIRRLLHP